MHWGESPRINWDKVQKNGILSGEGLSFSEREAILEKYGELPLKLFAKWRKCGISIKSSAETFAETIEVLRETRELEKNNQGAANLMRRIREELLPEADEYFSETMRRIDAELGKYRRLIETVNC